MHAYLLALEIEPVMVNKVYIALPQHCTVVHWFRSEESPAQVIKTVSEIASSQPPIEIVSGAPDLFGLAKDVPVNRILNDETIRAFHKRLHTELLQKLSIEDTEPQWTQAGFNPHVTRQRSGRFEEGRKVLVRTMYLVEALEPELIQQKKVTAKVYLGKAVS